MKRTLKEEKRILKAIKIFGGLTGMLILICLFIIRQYPIDIKQMNYEEIKSFNTMQDLSIYELLRLASSEKNIDLIFLNRDTTINLFKDLIEAGYNSPIIYIPSEKEKNVSDQEIKKIRRLINGDNSSYQIMSELASGCKRMNSSLGTEAQFILRRLEGEKIFCSSRILRHKYLNRLMFKIFNNNRFLNFRLNYL